MPKVFAEVVSDYQGGLPQDECVRWIGLSPIQIQRKLAERDFELSFYLISQLLDAQGFRKRKYLKSAPTKQVFQRNEQFEKIKQLKGRFLDEGLPVLSIDTKQKELIGNFARAGSYYDTQFRLANDHDFRSQADAIMVPHGLYDTGDNHGYLTLGTSNGGGSNNSRHYIVKQDLYHLAQRLEINLLIAHYPPYCSKYNPI
ncbi:MAG: ISAzo13 family transposase, partial [Bacteroidota bacterium]